jgi:hypothetical protein
MPIIVQSGLEVYNIIHNLLGEMHGGGWACPWCEQLGEYEVRDKTESDRLFPSSRLVENRHPIRFTCRYANEGAVEHHPVHSIEELVEEFHDKQIKPAPGKTWLGLAQEFLAIIGKHGGSRDVDPAKAYWSYEKLYVYHTEGAASWMEMGFSEATVKRLLLGRRGNRLTIPIPYLAVDEHGGLMPTGQYVQRTRRADGIETGPKYHWPSDLAPTLWYIPARGQEKIVRIVEGDTSAIAALDIWGDGPIATTQGSGSWSDNMTEYLLSKGHKTFHIYYDNDAPGSAYAQLVLKSLRRVAKSEIEINLVLWPDDAPEGADPRSILVEHGAERARTLLDQWIVPNGWFSMRQPNQGRLTAQYDEEYATGAYREEFEYERNKLTDLQTLRGSGPGSIHAEISEYVDNYKMLEDRRGSMLLIRSTPGTGKTYASVRFAEGYAKEYLQKRAKSIERTIDRLLAKDERTAQENERIERYRRGEYKKLSVFFVGPFIDGFDDIMGHAEHPELWYNLEARNNSNCRNIGFATKIANAGYPVMTSLCIEGGSCPFREACLEHNEEGVLQYMGQLNELQQYPIVYGRHNHLYMKSLLSQAKLIVVDEDPSAVVRGSISLYAEDLRKFDPYAMLEGMDAVHVKRLVEALANAVEGWQHEARYLTGRALVNYIDITEGPFTLHQIAQYVTEYGLLSTIAEWSPESEAEAETAPDGRIVSLLGLLVRDILREQEDWNGQIFIENGIISFYPLEPFNIDARKRVVALDATGIQAKYELCFDREVEEFRAEVYPENARTVVIVNTEATMNTLLSDVGMRDEEVATHGVREGVTLGGPTPADFSIFEDPIKVKNPAMRDMLKLALGLTYRHGELLLVTYKTARIFAERFIKKHFPTYYPHISFGHFRALRGLDTFKHKPAVLVVGTPRLPPNVLRRDIAAMHSRDDELLDLKIERVDEYYHLTPWYYPTMKLVDQRTHPLIDELEAGEIEQVAGRIRAAVHDDPENPKHIYLMTARPAMRWHSYYGPGSDGYVNDEETDISFITLQKALWLYVEAEQSAALIKKYINEFNKVPSIRKLEEWAGISNHKARKIRKYWDEQNS